MKKNKQREMKMVEHHDIINNKTKLTTLLCRYLNLVVAFEGQIIA